MTLIQAKKRSKLYLASTGLYTIPQDWFSEKFGALIGDLQSGFASGLRDDQGIVQLRMNNISNDGRLIFEELLKVPVPSDIENFRLQEDDIIFNNTNSLDLIGKTAIVEEPIDYTFSNHLTRIRVDINILLPYWIYLILLRYKERAVFRSICNTHVGQSGIGKKELRNLEIFFPPLREQRKISSILSKVDELIQKTDQIIEQTQRLKKGLMQRLLTRGIGHAEFKKTPIGEIPQSWTIVKLDDVSNKITKGIFDLDPLNYVSKGIPFLRISDIRDNAINLSTTKYILDSTNEQFLSSQLSPGDIVLAKVGASAASVDKIAKIPTSINKCNISQNLIGIKVNQNRVTSEFLLKFLQLPRNMNIVLSGSNTTTFKSIQLNVLRHMNIPLPSLEEQEKIVYYLTLIDNKFHNEMTYNSNIINLKKGLMQKLLTGKIRVKV